MRAICNLRAVFAMLLFNVKKNNSFHRCVHFESSDLVENTRVLRGNNLPILRCTREASLRDTALCYIDPCLFQPILADTCGRTLEVGKTGFLAAVKMVDHSRVLGY